jgi:beta-glucosidase-like glycosyl hydrolase
MGRNWEVSPRPATRAVQGLSKLIASHPLSSDPQGFAPDVYFNGIASKLSVHGIQDAGVQACAKHFIAYEQESYRTLYLAPRENNKTALYQQVDSIVDDKTLHELYGPGFAEATRAGVASVMCAVSDARDQPAASVQ